MLELAVRQEVEEEAVEAVRQVAQSLALLD
jgi:hypothetical protein